MLKCTFAIFVCFAALFGAHAQLSDLINAINIEQECPSYTGMENIDMSKVIGIKVYY